MPGSSTVPQSPRHDSNLRLLLYREVSSPLDHGEECRREDSNQRLDCELGRHSTGALASPERVIGGNHITVPRFKRGSTSQTIFNRQPKRPHCGRNNGENQLSSNPRGLPISSCSRSELSRRFRSRSRSSSTIRWCLRQSETRFAT